MLTLADIYFQKVIAVFMLRYCCTLNNCFVKSSEIREENMTVSVVSGTQQPSELPKHICFSLWYMAGRGEVPIFWVHLLVLEPGPYRSDDGRDHLGWVDGT